MAYVTSSSLYEAAVHMACAKEMDQIKDEKSKDIDALRSVSEPTKRRMQKAYSVRQQNRVFRSYQEYLKAEKSHDLQNVYYPQLEDQTARRQKSKHSFWKGWW